MHIIIGLLLVALLFLGCWALSYAIILMRPHVQELRAEKRAERHRQQQQRLLEPPNFARNMVQGVAVSLVLAVPVALFLLLLRPH
jgi:hypothetical protein